MSEEHQELKHQTHPTYEVPDFMRNRTLSGLYVPEVPPKSQRLELISKIFRASDDQLQRIADILEDRESSPFMNTPETCECLGISRATLFRHMQKGKIRPLPLDRKGLVFSRTEINRYLAGHQPEFTGGHCE